MRSHVVDVRTGANESVVDLTDRVERFLDAEAGQADGLLHVFVPHATAGVAIIETGAGSDDDLLAIVTDLLPSEGPRGGGSGGGGWRHRHGSPGHGRDHVLPAFIAPYATLPVLRGNLELGTWQRVCLVDTNRDNPVRSVRFSFLAG